jgi:hypothetical protein
MTTMCNMSLQSFLSYDLHSGTVSIENSPIDLYELICSKQVFTLNLFGFSFIVSSFVRLFNPYHTVGSEKEVRRFLKPYICMMSLTARALQEIQTAGVYIFAQSTLVYF